MKPLQGARSRFLQTDGASRDLALRATYIGGPTVLLELSGFRLLTDPTFDPAGTEYHTPLYTLRKTTSPAIGVANVGLLDAVLLSHDHHFDNLDHAGRALLPRADRVITTRAGAERLGAGAMGLAPWTSTELRHPDARALRITGTPARHGPADGDRGPVTGFLLTDVALPDAPDTPAVYVSGDTVWYDGLAPIAARADVRVALLFLGAACVPEVGPAHLTMTAAEGVELARALPRAIVVPVHHAGWAHFGEGRAEIERAFAQAGLTKRLCWLEPGRPTDIVVR
jgi:L-ascorbate metabolism protein UlaG (beta-lactamase superfamily)